MIYSFVSMLLCLWSLNMNAFHFLIQAYKRVGGQVHNADMGRGVIGVIDVTNLMV